MCPPTAATAPTLRGAMTSFKVITYDSPGNKGTVGLVLVDDY